MNKVTVVIFQRKRAELMEAARLEEERFVQKCHANKIAYDRWLKVRGSY